LASRMWCLGFRIEGSDTNPEYVIDQTTWTGRGVRVHVSRMWFGQCRA